MNAEMSWQEKIAFLTRKIRTYKYILKGYEDLINSGGKRGMSNGFIHGSIPNTPNEHPSKSPYDHPDWLISLAEFFEPGDDIFVHTYNVERIVVPYHKAVTRLDRGIGYDEETAKCNRDGLQMVIRRLEDALSKQLDAYRRDNPNG